MAVKNRNIIRRFIDIILFYMKKIKLFIFLLPVLTLMEGCIPGGFGIRGNGNVISQSRDLGSFSGIEVSGSMNVFIKQGTPARATIEAESNLLSYIETGINGGTLVIQTQRNTWIQNTKDINVYITAPDFDKVELSGSGNINSQGLILNNQSFHFRVTGSGDIKANINAPQINATITGSGNLELSGQTRNIKIDIIGSGTFYGKPLQGEKVQADILGSGNAQVNASIQLDATIAGSGNIYYSGNPRISSHIMGSGSVIKK